VIYLLLSAGTS